MGNTEEARRHFLETAARDLGASAGGLVLDGGYRPGVEPSVFGATLLNVDAGNIRMARATLTASNPVYTKTVLRASSLPVGTVISNRQQDAVSTRDWNRSAFVTEYAHPAGFEHFLCSHRTMGTSRVRGIGLFRKRRDRSFTEEDRDVLHILNLEMPRLYPSHDVRLPPRARQTLDQLLTGAADKEIAVRLGLSVHTVRQYVKTILSAYRVHGRAELIARVKGADTT
jgi:DNA-binding CsgD family transcriptional regulator